jgi:hypothetical protein
LIHFILAQGSNLCGWVGKSGQWADWGRRHLMEGNLKFSTLSYVVLLYCTVRSWHTWVHHWNNGIIIRCKNRCSIGIYNMLCLVLCGLILLSDFETHFSLKRVNILHSNRPSINFGS